MPTDNFGYAQMMNYTASSVFDPVSGQMVMVDPRSSRYPDPFSPGIQSQEKAMRPDEQEGIDFLPSFLFYSLMLSVTLLFAFGVVATVVIFFS